MAELTYHAHASYSLSDGNHDLLFDPFITGNPMATISADDLNPDYILLTHGHSDHIGDAVPVARRCGATLPDS